MIKFDTVPLFLITDQTIQILEGVINSKNITLKLEEIKNIEFRGESVFCNRLIHIFDENEYYAFKDVIIQYSNTEWFKPKNFIHFTKKISKYNPKSHKVEIKQYNSLLKEVSNRNTIAKHAFYPLIHYTIKERRYKEGLKKRKRRGIKIKRRHINFATHIDTHIYSYYAKVFLGTEYEKFLSKARYNECFSTRRFLKVV